MSQTVRKVVLIGAGNVATQLGKELKKKGFTLLQVYSRTQEAAEELALLLDCEATNSLSQVRKDAEVYLFSVKDSALESLVSEVGSLHSGALFLHTAGSMPIEVFKGKVRRYGVLYPMQTFSKSQEVDFSRIPCFIEGSSEEVQGIVRELAGTLTEQIYELTSEKRRYLHLAAVFACNFTNHLYALADDILQTQGIPFAVMHPLMDETVRKVRYMAPLQAQTGPALRYDRNVMDAQLDLLGDSPCMQEIYRVMSRSIYEKNNQ